MDEEKERKPDKVIKIKVPKFTKKFRENPWIVSTFVLIVLAIVLVVNGSGNGITGYISADDAGDLVLDLAKSQVGDAEVVEVKDVGSNLYEVTLLINGQMSPIYITKDGEFFGSMSPLSLLTQQSPQTQQTPGEYSEEDIEKISVFIDCLAEKGVKIYGANWCGWTKKLVVETLGGFDIAAPIYVECTENEELCSSEGVSGYPTTKINGELYGGPRTFEGLSEATGCPAPEVAVQSNNTGQEASC